MLNYLKIRKFIIYWSQSLIATGRQIETGLSLVWFFVGFFSGLYPRFLGITRVSEPDYNYYKCHDTSTVTITNYNNNYYVQSTVDTDQRSIKWEVTRDLKLLAQDLVLDGVDADVLGLTSSQQMLTIGRVAQRPKWPDSFNNVQLSRTKSDDICNFFTFLYHHYHYYYYSIVWYHVMVNKDLPKALGEQKNRCRDVCWHYSAATWWMIVNYCYPSENALQG